MRTANQSSNRSRKKARRRHIQAATDVLGSARWRAHNAFDRLWKSGWCSRDAAYRMLAALLEIPIAAAHFALMNLDQCQAVERHFAKMAPKDRKIVCRQKSIDYRIRRRELQEADLEEAS